MHFGALSSSRKALDGVKKKPVCTYTRNKKWNEWRNLFFNASHSFSLSPFFRWLYWLEVRSCARSVCFCAKGTERKKFTCRRASNASSPCEWWKRRNRKRFFCVAISLEDMLLRSTGFRFKVLLLLLFFGRFFSRFSFAHLNFTHR